MLPPFIIEQIRKREEEEKRGVYEQPQLELPIRPPPKRHEEAPAEQGERGVIVFEF